MKNKYYTVAGVILCVIAAVYALYASSHPDLSYPWAEWVNYVIYGLYAIYTVLLFCMPRLSWRGIGSCIVLAMQLIALALLTISISMRSNNGSVNWYLPAALFLTAAGNFTNFYLTRRNQHHEKHS